MSENDAAPLFEINDGVRRAKAASATGRTHLPATIDGGTDVRELAVDALRVPRMNVGKHVIDITREPAEERWLDTYVRTVNGEQPPPIDVRTAPGSAGVAISDVPVVKRGRRVDPFTGEEQG